MYKIGEKVEIHQLLAPLKHRFAKGKVFGFVTKIDGEYHFVRPAWCKWEAELLRNEISPV